MRLFIRNLIAALNAHRQASLAGAAITIAMGVLLVGTRLGDSMSHLSFDLLAQVIVGTRPRDVILVEMDEPAYRALGQDYDRLWDRSLHARLLGKLADDNARLTVLDVFFGDAGTNQPPGPALTEAIRRNQVFEDALKRNPRVVLAAYWSEATHVSVAGGGVIPPYAPFSDAVGDRWGIAKVYQDTDDRVRRHFTGTDYYPSLSWRAAQLLGMPPNDAAEHRLAERWIRYYGPTPAFPRMSYHQALEQPVGFFRDKIVVVGGRPQTLMLGQQTDVFPTPPMRWRGGYTPGAEVIATMTLNLVQGDWLRRLPFFVEFALVIGWGAVLGWGLVLVAPMRGALLALGAALAACVFGWFLTIATSGWYAWTIVCVVQTPLAFGWGLVWHSRRLAREKQALEVSLAGFKTGRAVFEHGRAEEAAAHPGANIPPEEVPTVVATAVIRPVSIPNHEMLSLCGEGAYGQVWLARDELGLFHAVKLVFQRHFKDAGPYEREFRGLQKFTPISRNHAGLVHILHVGRNQAEGYFFYIMEAADPEEGGTILDPRTYRPRNLHREIWKRTRLPVGECIDLGLHLTAALDYLHGRQLVHRDIKPANILFVDGQPKLADIGLVTDAALTSGSATYVGTPGYIAPEGPGRPEGDIYALGMVLYEAVTGLTRKDKTPVLPDLDETPEVRGFLQIVQRACEFDPLSRYQSAAIFHADLLALKRTQAPNVAAA